jgi:uncharacterized membrane protein (DUF106 family)
MNNILCDGIARELADAKKQMAEMQTLFSAANAENEKLKKLLKKRNRKNKQESQGMCTYEGMKGFVPI